VSLRAALLYKDSQEDSTMIMIVVLTFVIGVVAGLRAMTPLAAVSWGARLGHVPLEGTHLSWLGGTVAPWIFTVLAIGEIINDKLPATPSRKIPPQFITRVVTGAFSGAAIGLSKDLLALGLVAGALGAVAGTLGGAAVRGKLAAAFGKDLPAALLEDVVAIGLAVAVVSQL
jgi:uncharacterized membrane protein